MATSYYPVGQQALQTLTDAAIRCEPVRLLRSGATTLEVGSKKR